MRAERGSVKRSSPERTGGELRRAVQARPGPTRAGCHKRRGARCASRTPPVMTRLMTKKDSSRSVSVVIEGETVGLAQAVEHGLEWREDRRGEADDRAEGDRDGAACTFRPVGHREAGDETPDEVTALTQKL